MNILKKYFLFFLILILFSFYGCDYFGPGTADYKYPVSDKYMIYRSNTISTELVKNNDESMTTIVGRMVTGIAWDKNFILVEQTKDDVKNYWIIDINKDKMYSQLKYEDFETQRSLLNIDSNLKLKSPDEYK